MNEKKSDNSNLYLALLHFPVYNKKREVVATAITPMDIHDLSRLARTYALRRCYVISPLKSQLKLAKRMMHYWIHGPGMEYNPRRKEALVYVDAKENLRTVLDELEREWNRKPARIATTARKFETSTSYRDMRIIIKKEKNRPFIIVLGTGWGLTDEFIRNSEYVLKPIEPVEGGYNHLSVRSAASIIVDRLAGEEYN